MKKLLFISTFLFTLLLNSNGQKSQFSIGFISSIEVNKYNVVNINTNYEYSPNFSYSAGIGINYKLNEKLFLKSGLVHYAQGYQIEFNYNLAGGSLMPIQSDLSIFYLRIPLKVGMQFDLSDQIKFKPAIGINTAFQYETREMTIYSDNVDRDKEWLRNSLNEVQLAVIIDSELEIKVSDRINVCIGPFVSKGINKIHSYAMSSGQFTYGILMGMQYYL